MTVSNRTPADSGAFRVPNSVIQGLTTDTDAGLNQLPAFEMITLLGLISEVVPNEPSQEVRLPVSRILDIITVGSQVSHVVEREWELQSGRKQKRRYSSRRPSPQQRERIHTALLSLFRRTVEVVTYDPRTKRRLESRTGHILDTFGYDYRVDGERIDVDSLLPNYSRVNVGTAERPVWRVQTQRGEELVSARPSGVYFRIGKLLANEIAKVPGTWKFTLLARGVFAVFREFSRQPNAIRLTLLTFRQTQSSYTRRLEETLVELGWDLSHRERAIRECEQILTRLRDRKIVRDWELDPSTNRMRIDWVRDWYNASPSAQEGTEG